MSRVRRKNQSELFLAVLAAGATLASFGLHSERAFAVTKTFTNAAGGDAAHAVWSNPGNWDPAGVPAASDDVIIPNSLTSTGRALVDGPGFACHDIVGDGKFVRLEDYTNTGSLTLAFNSITGGPNGVADFYIRGGVATVNHMDIRFTDIGQGHSDGTFNTTGILHLNPGGTMTTSGELIVGRLDFGTSHGVGTFDIGANSTVNSYAMYAGAAGGEGTIIQSAGASVNSHFPIHVGTELLSVGAYVMNGGTLTSGAETSPNGFLFIGRSSSTGTFTLNNGVVNAGDLYLASDGSGSGNMIMNGGTLSASAIYFGTTGTPTHSFVWNGGTIQNKPDVDMALNSFTTTLEIQLAGSGAHHFIVNDGHYATQYSAFFSGAGNLAKDGGGTMIFNGSNTYTGGTTISGGTLQVAIGATMVGDVQNDAAFVAIADLSLGNIDGAGTTSVGDGVAAFHVSAKHVRQGGLTITPSSTVSINTNGGNAGMSRVGALSLSGGTLDLNDNDLIVTTGTVADIRTAVATARHNGAWDQAGITSTTARNNAAHNTTIGVLSGAEYKAMNGASATFDGAAVSNSDVLAKYTYYGDTDFNGKVNFDDYVRTDNGFNNHLSGWMNGDFDGNGAVNFDDYVLIDLAFNTQSGTLGRALSFLDGSDRSGAGMSDPALRVMQQHLAEFGAGYAHGFLSAVPEPSSLALFALAAASATARRRRLRD